MIKELALDSTIIDIYDPKLKGLTPTELVQMVDVISVNRQLMRLKLKRESINRSVAANNAWTKRRMKTRVVGSPDTKQWIEGHEHSQHYQKIKDLLN